MYERKRQGSPPSLFLLLPLSSPPGCTSPAAGWPAVPMGGEVKVKMLHHISLLEIWETWSQTAHPAFFLLLVDVSVRAANGRGNVFKVSTSSQCVNGWPVALWSQLEKPQMWMISCIWLHYWTALLWASFPWSTPCSNSQHSLFTV